MWEYKNTLADIRISEDKNRRFRKGEIRLYCSNQKFLFQGATSL